MIQADASQHWSVLLSSAGITLVLINLVQSRHQLFFIKHVISYCNTSALLTELPGSALILVEVSHFVCAFLFYASILSGTF
jgi:hypothetical protein